jgi:serine protease
MSLGACGVTSDPTVDAAITYARGLNVTLVAAAGNFDPSCITPNAVQYPANNPNVIAVAAVGPGPAHASYSSSGPEVAVAAPGGDGSCNPGCFVWSTTWSPSPGNYVYAGFQGTSMATPHVSGLVALMLSSGITGPAHIKSILQSTATCAGIASCPGPQYGAGLVDAAAAVGAPGVNAGRLCAFTGSISGTTITRQSPNPAPRVQDNGGFTITSAPSGVWSVFLWQDSNNNGLVDTGDAYGRLDSVAVFQNQTNTLASTIRVQTYGTGALAGQPALSVPGGVTCP